jgi:iron complex outermembrane receptor protein
MSRKKTIPTTHRARLLPVMLALLLVRCSACAAAEPGTPARYAIEQPSQPLAESLHAIAHETSTSVLFDPRVVQGRVAHPVSGHLSAFEAITAALQDTGLIAELMPDGAVVVRSAAAPAGVPGVPASGASGAMSSEEAAREVDAEWAARGGGDDGSPTPDRHRGQGTGPLQRRPRQAG